LILKIKYFPLNRNFVLGSIVATTLSQFYPSRINGIHISMPIADDTNILAIFYNSLSVLFPSLVYSEEEIKSNITHRYSFISKIGVILREAGYMHLQATTPDTVAQGLTDSPVGLLAYILEKYYVWSFDVESQVLGKKGASLEFFDKDDLLTVITLYWMTNSIHSSIRFYKAYFNIFNKPWPLYNSIRSRVPDEVNVAVQLFKNEIMLVPEKIVQLRYPNLRKFSLENGGHFAAFQNPKVTSDDFVKFINLVLEKN